VLRANPRVSQSVLAQKIEVSRSTVQRKMAELVKAGVTERIGRTRGCWLVKG
jgi:DNA-binding Lrp family transcriptional regulator